MAWGFPHRSVGTRKTFCRFQGSLYNRGWKPLPRLLHLPFETIVLTMNGTFQCMVRVAAIIHPSVGAASPPRSILIYLLNVSFIIKVHPNATTAETSSTSSREVYPSRA